MTVGLSDASTGSRTPASRTPAVGAVSPPSAPVLGKEPLAAVGFAPPRTLAFIEPSKAGASDSYTVSFAPYGYGPGGARRSLVVRVNRSTPVGKPKRPYPFQGRNVMLDTSGITVGRVIEVGGTYSGTIVLVPKDGMLVPSLRDVR